MNYLIVFIILYFLTGATFVSYDFKIFQKTLFYIRAIFSPGGMLLNPKLRQSFHSIYSPIDSPAYVSGRNYGFALLHMFIWPLFPRVLLPWFYLSRQPGIKFVINFYIIPAILLIVFYWVAIQGLVEYGKIWQAGLILVGFTGAVWLLCRRRDKEMDKWRSARNKS